MDWGALMADRGVEFHGVSDDPTYGYEESNPVKVGSIPAEYDYMELLRGPAGQSLEYFRIGSCCGRETPEGYVLLDRWEITYPGLEEPVVIYLSAFELDDPMAPMGFTYVGYEGEPVEI
jgi:hypothetical protein